MDSSPYRLDEPVCDLLRLTLERDLSRRSDLCVSNTGSCVSNTDSGVSNTDSGVSNTDSCVSNTDLCLIDGLFPVQIGRARVRPAAADAREGPLAPRGRWRRSREGQSGPLTGVQRYPCNTHSCVPSPCVSLSNTDDREKVRVVQTGLAVSSKPRPAGACY